MVKLKGKVEELLELGLEQVYEVVVEVLVMVVMAPVLVAVVMTVAALEVAPTKMGEEKLSLLAAVDLTEAERKPVVETPNAAAMTTDVGKAVENLTVVALEETVTEMATMIEIFLANYGEILSHRTGRTATGTAAMAAKESLMTNFAAILSLRHYCRNQTMMTTRLKSCR